MLNFLIILGVLVGSNFQAIADESDAKFSMAINHKLNTLKPFGQTNEGLACQISRFPAVSMGLEIKTEGNSILINYAGSEFNEWWANSSWAQLITDTPEITEVGLTEKSSSSLGYRYTDFKFESLTEQNKIKVTAYTFKKYLLVKTDENRIECIFDVK